MKYISSAKNEQIKEWKKLLTKKERDRKGLFLVEGFHLVEEALTANLIQHILVLEHTEIPQKWTYKQIPITTVSDEVMRALSDTETPQGIIAICKKEMHKDSLITKGKYLLIDAVQDPGNLGTLIRTADAAGMDAVLIGEGSADIYNPKVVRSTQGSLFHLPVLKVNLRTIIDQLEVPVFGTALEGGVPFEQVDKLDAFALIVGNEGQGVSAELLQQTTKNLYIPIYGKSESLNVAIAAGILMYYLRK